MNHEIRPRQLMAICEALQPIFQANQFADQAISEQLKAGPSWSDDERAFIAETTYGVVRHYRLLRELLGRNPQQPKDWLRMIAYYLVLESRRLPRWEEFSGVNPSAIQRQAATLKQDRRIRESLPNWLDERGEKELGKRWTPTIGSLNHAPSTVLRCNALKTNPNQLIKSLKKEGITAEPIEDHAVLVTERRHLFNTITFKEGWFEIQDYSSQQVAPFLQVKPGMTVIDACAGAGGKTLHLAALMENRGRLLALDTDEKKLEALLKRARRAGVGNVTTRTITSTKIIKRQDGAADRLLLDVPCSGLGVLRRNPDTKWRLTPSKLDNLIETQAHLLSYYPRMLKPGGLFAYVTCSVLPSENEEQVKRFLAENGEQFQLLEQKRIWPQDQGDDGFFMALFEKGKGAK